jgi:putative peptide zinc metalloprotease protein
VAMIPVGGATKTHPALFVIGGKRGKPPVAILSTSAPDPAGAPVASGVTAGSGATTSTSAGGSTPSNPSDATAFPFALPAAPGPGGTQALATNTKDGGVTYDIAYALVDVSGGANVTNTNSAYALAHCKACTTVAVSFQVVLVVGESKNIAPINAAGAPNYDCPACTALADQIVVTLKAQPSPQLIATLENDLKQLNALPALGAGGTPTAVASEVATVQQEIDSALQSSGLETNPPGSSSTTSTGTTSTPTVPTTPTSTTPTSPSTPASPTSTGQSTTPATTGSPSTTSTTTAAPPPATSSTSTSTTPAPSSTSGSAASQSGGATTATTSTTPAG